MLTNSLKTYTNEKYLAVERSIKNESLQTVASLNLLQVCIELRKIISSRYGSKFDSKIMGHSEQIPSFKTEDTSSRMPFQRYPLSIVFI